MVPCCEPTLPHCSRRADKAAGKRVTLSPASPTVHIVEISVEEWRGKKLAVQQVAENVQQHMRVCFDDCMGCF